MLQYIMFKARSNERMEEEPVKSRQMMEEVLESRQTG